MSESVSFVTSRSSPLAAGAGAVALTLLQVLRGVLLVVLLVTAPLLQVVLGSFAVLGVGSALFLRLAGAHFAFWTLLGSAFGAVLVLTGVHVLIRVLSGERAPTRE